MLRPVVYLYDLWRFRIISDKKFLKTRFRRKMGYKLNLKSPKTLNEKIQWIKLYDRIPLRTKCADKVAVREYVKEIIGEEYLVPLVMITEDVNDLSYSYLPDKPFIIKTNHDSGGYKIIRDKNEVQDWNKLRNFFSKRLKTNYFHKSKEWQYKDIVPKILVEDLLQTKTGNIPEDFKVQCFNGNPEFIQTDANRGSREHTRNWYDKNWERAEFVWATKLKTGEETLPSLNETPKPSVLEEMLELAEMLSKPFCYARIDFYLLEDKIYFGEITFSHDSGFRPVVPFEWDRKLGEMITLPKT